MVSTDNERKMLDIHMHVTPGVDDGAQDLEMAARMLQQAKEQGICGVFATPHNNAFDYDGDHTWEQYEKLRLMAQREFPGLEIHRGCEVMCRPDRMNRICASLKRGKYPTMGDTNYVLIEFPQWVHPESTTPCVEALLDAGYTPIIAHTERYPHLMNHMELVDLLRQMGAKIQINAYSLDEEQDDSIREWARRLVLERKVTFMGTDAHRTGHRPPRAERGLCWLYANTEQEYADAIAWGNAHRLLCRESK